MIASARSAPPSTPSDSSGASSRTCAQPNALTDGPQSFGALLGHERGAQAGLRGAERDALDFAHLAGRVPEQSGQHDRAALVAREAAQRGSQPLGVVAQL